MKVCYMIVEVQKHFSFFLKSKEKYVVTNYLQGKGKREPG